MATIPQSTNLQKKHATGTKAVTGYSTANIRDPFDHLSNMLQSEADAQTEYQVKTAEADLVTQQSEFEDRATKDQDYGTLEKRYSEDMNKNIKKFSDNIQIPSVKQAFIESQRVRMQQGTERVRNIAFGKQKDYERASTNDRLNKIKEAAIKGDIDYSSASNMVDGILGAAVNSEFYSHEEKGKVSKAFKDNLAISKLDTMTADERLNALSQPWAKNLPSGVVSAIRKEAKAEAIQNKVYSLADEQIAKGVTLSEGMKAGLKIKDPDERLAYENRFKSLYSTEATAKKEADYNATEAVLNKYYSGGKPTPEEYAKLPASGKASVDRLLKAEADAAEKKLTALEADQEEDRVEQIRKYDIALKTGSIKFTEIPEETLLSLPSKEFDMLVKSSKMNDGSSSSSGADYDIATYQVLNDILSEGTPESLVKGRKFLIDNADKFGKKYVSMSDRISKAMDDPDTAGGIKSLATYSKKIGLMNSSDKDGKERARWMDYEFIKWHDQYQHDNGKMPTDKEAEAEMNKLYLDQKEKGIIYGTNNISDQEDYIKNIIKRRGEEAIKRQQLEKKTDNKTSFYQNIKNVESSGGDYSVVNSLGYTGAYQFAEGTAKPYLNKMGKTWIDFKNDPNVQDKVMVQWTKTNKKSLEKNGHKPTELNLWIAHNQGAGGANQILKGKPSKKVIANMKNNMPENMKPTAENYIAHWSRKFSNEVPNV